MGSPKPGNAPGEVLGPVSPGAKRAEAANPAVRAESPAELGAIDALQLVLDLAGMIPGAGAIPDLINAAISLCRGDFVGAVFSAGSAIPVLGDAAGAAKILKNSNKYLEAAKVIEQKVLPMLPKGIRKKLEDYLAKMRAKIDEVMKKEKSEASPKTAESKDTNGAKSKGSSDCLLRPYSPDTCKAQGKTGHHVVPDRAFRLGTSRTGAARQQIEGGLSEAEGLVICVEGATPAASNQHGKIHRLYDPMEKAIGLAGQPPGTAPLSALEAAGAAAAGKVTGCSPAKLMAQLRTYHQSKGMGPEFKVRADERGALARSLSPKTFGVPGAGDF